MRLTAIERESIVSAIKQVDSAAKPYLFGSRVDDTKRGGDIDLFIISTNPSLDTKLHILSALEKKLGERKIDLILEKGFDSPFAKTIRHQAVPL